MSAKPIRIVLALLIFALAACSNEPTSEPPTTEKFHTEEEVQATVEDSGPSSPTSKLDLVATQDECTALLDNHCVACHHASRFCQKLGKKNKKGWKRTIKNMSTHGLLITPQETETMAQCLDQQEQKVKDYCQ